MTALELGEQAYLDRPRSEYSEWIANNTGEYCCPNDATHRQSYIPGSHQSRPCKECNANTGPWVLRVPARGSSVDTRKPILVNWTESPPHFI